MGVADVDWILRYRGGFQGILENSGVYECAGEAVHLSLGYDFGESGDRHGAIQARVMGEVDFVVVGAAIGDVAQQ